MLNNNFSSSFWRSNRFPLTLLLNMTTGRKTVNIVKGLFRFYLIVLRVFLSFFFKLFFCASFKTVVTNSAWNQNKSQNIQCGRDLRKSLVHLSAWIRVSYEMKPCCSALYPVDSPENLDCTTFLSNLWHSWIALWWQSLSFYPVKGRYKKCSTSKGRERRDLFHISYLHSSHL